MREEQVARISEPNVTMNSPIFLGLVYLFRDLRRVIPQYAYGDVLDVGCGNKPYRTFFDEKTTSYVGCDVVQSHLNAVDILCKATDIPLPDNSKDTVFSTQVIEHVADHKTMLAEMFRILKPGGRIIVSGPMAWEHHEEPHDFFRFTRYGFQYLFAEAGFREVEIIPNGGKWALTGQTLLLSLRSSLTKKTPLWRIAKGLYFLFRVKWIINGMFYLLDKRDFDDSSVLNFIVVARKPADAAPNSGAAGDA